MKLKARSGKIAALPEDIRGELNQRLADGEQEPQILPWLNALPAVRRLMEERFGGKPVGQQNLSAWRRGGFQDWRFAREHAADTRRLMELTMEQAKAGGVSILESVAAAAAVHLLQVFSDLTEVVRERQKEECRMQNGERANEPLGVAGLSVRRPLTPALSPSGGEGERGGEAAGGLAGDLEAGRCGGADGAATLPAPSSQGEGEEWTEDPPSPSYGAASEDEDDGEERYSLAERVVIICRATAGIGVLRRAEQGETRLQLQRERLAQTGEMVEIRREEKDSKIRAHEVKADGKKTTIRNALHRPSGGGLSKEAMSEIAKEIKLL